MALALHIFIQDQTKNLAFKILVHSQNLWGKTESAHLVMTISTSTLPIAFKTLAQDRQSFKSMENVLRNVQASISTMKLQTDAPSNVGKTKPLIMARIDASVLNTFMSTA